MPLFVVQGHSVELTSPSQLFVALTTTNSCPSSAIMSKQADASEYALDSFDFNMEQFGMKAIVPMIAPLIQVP